MARKPREHYLGAYYHVMLRGNGGMQIFPAICDHQFMQQLRQLQKIDNRMIKVTLKELVELICGFGVRLAQLHIPAHP